MSWLKEKFMQLWGAWSAVQDREDDIWHETVHGVSAKEEEAEPGAACSVPEKVPDLAELVERRNEQLRRNSH